MGDLAGRWRELNKAYWDERVPIHLGGAFYDMEGFRARPDSLKDFETAEVGDVRGKRLIHLQCHFGRDTLSWAVRGAQVTGLDFSPPAIEAASRLATELGIDARFLTADVYDAVSAVAGETFDIVYVSSVLNDETGSTVTRDYWSRATDPVSSRARSHLLRPTPVPGAQRRRHLPASPRAPRASPSPTRSAPRRLEPLDPARIGSAGPRVPTGVKPLAGQASSQVRSSTKTPTPAPIHKRCVNSPTVTTTAHGKAYGAVEPR
ncbi:class I SAM-dependent methyltransferase [Streptomyces sp. NPDC001658]